MHRWELWVARLRRCNVQILLQLYEIFAILFQFKKHPAGFDMQLMKEVVKLCSRGQQWSPGRVVQTIVGTEIGGAADERHNV